ncbi:MAG: hypothetical protein JW769_02585 [Parachlamydiales bacterium]|nr:hypothetical protein [Parachlamydiales bacterium]
MNRSDLEIKTVEVIRKEIESWEMYEYGAGFLRACEARIYVLSLFIFNSVRTVYDLVSDPCVIIWKRVVSNIVFPNSIIVQVVTVTLKNLSLFLSTFFRTVLTVVFPEAFYVSRKSFRRVYSIWHTEMQKELSKGMSISFSRIAHLLQQIVPFAVENARNDAQALIFQELIEQSMQYYKGVMQNDTITWDQFIENIQTGKINPSDFVNQDILLEQLSQTLQINEVSIEALEQNLLGSARALIQNEISSVPNHSLDTPLFSVLYDLAAIEIATTPVPFVEEFVLKSLIRAFSLAQQYYRANNAFDVSFQDPSKEELGFSDILSAFLLESSSVSGPLKLEHCISRLALVLSQWIDQAELENDFWKVRDRKISVNFLENCKANEEICQVLVSSIKAGLNDLSQEQKEELSQLFLDLESTTISDEEREKKRRDFLGQKAWLQNVYENCWNLARWAYYFVPVETWQEICADESSLSSQ